MKSIATTGRLRRHASEFFKEWALVYLPFSGAPIFREGV
jgi:hypothetical protein